MQPTMTPIAHRTCDWALSDRHGEAYPCGRPATHRVASATEEYNGVFCEKHARLAVKQSIEAARREDEWR